jgi:hypothetical protein
MAPFTVVESSVAESRSGPGGQRGGAANFPHSAG